MDLGYHSVVKQIVGILEERKVWFETFEHGEVRTSEEAAQVRDGYTLDQGAKALIVRVKITNQDKRFVMLVLPGSARFDSVKVKQQFKAKDVRFATEAEVSLITRGVLPGGVPPWGQLFGLPVLVDPLLLKNDKIIFNAGDRRFSIAMKSKDFIEVVKPTIYELI